MQPTRRHFLVGTIGAAIAVPPAIRRALAQEAWPARPIRMIIPFAAGGQTDVTARLLAQAMSRELGREIVSENRTGAGGVIAAEAAVRMPADGYNLFFGTLGTHGGVNAALYPNARYDVVRDFAPVALITTSPNIILVNPGLPVHTMREFLDFVRAGDGRVTNGLAGAGSSTHLTGEYLMLETGLKLNNVMYRGGAPALADLAAGHVQVMVAGISEAVPLVQDGRVRAIAVSSAGRNPALPEVPAIAETVPGFEAVAWFALYAPAGTPQPILDRLNAAANTALADPEIRRRYAELGATPEGGPPARLAALMAQEIPKWGRVVRAADMKPE
jgi:tripartite-type tricarboxylate transporter receptor subunit TctC